jgi:uncharacterized short protein YbdD (DUF466 family)
MAGVRRLLAFLRAWAAWLNGDTAYVRYCAHLHRAHPGAPLPSRADFHRAETERRWNGIRRCC